MLDGTVTGNAASLQTTGTLDGSNLGYGENKRARPQQQVHRDRSGPARSRTRRSRPTTDATFVKVGGLQLNAVTATTTYEQQTRSSSRRNVKEQRRASSTPPAASSSIPTTRSSTCRRWRCARRASSGGPRPAAAATVKYGSDRVELQDVKLVSGDQSLDVNGAFALKGDIAGGRDQRAGAATSTCSSSKRCAAEPRAHGHG